MITIEEAIYLLNSDLVSEMYLPHTYLSAPDVDRLIQIHNWMILPSEIQGWILLRKRRVFQD